MVTKRRTPETVLEFPNDSLRNTGIMKFRVILGVIMAGAVIGVLRLDHWLETGTGIGSAATPRPDHPLVIRGDLGKGRQK